MRSVDKLLPFCIKAQHQNNPRRIIGMGSKVKGNARLLRWPWRRKELEEVQQIMVIFDV
jgi:hypothetical protein